MDVPRPFRVLIIGGTGVFGSRLVRLLAGDDGIDVTIAARRPSAGVIALDYRRDLDEALRRGGYHAVVHSAGPFQGQDYQVAEACIRHGVHYIDLADDRAFVCSIDRLDDAARAAGVLVCAGASTVPALTGAVLAEALKEGPVERVSFGIAPGNDAPRGPALVEAILSGAGHPIADRPERRVWGDLRRLHIPGLGGRWVTACDLPELPLFRKAFGVRDTYAGAGLELSVLHVGLWLLSWLVRLRLVRSLAPAARPLAWIADRLRPFGSDRGGLRMDFDGRRSWYLVAEGGDGPFVPAVPAAALLRKLAAGDVDKRGATPCLGLLSLAECEAEWRRARLRIGSAWMDEALHPSLYHRALGEAFERLPAICRRLHDSGASIWRGRCEVEGAANTLGKALAWLFQFPAKGSGPIEVEFGVDGARETWTRRVAGRAMRSQQFIGSRRPRGWIAERFGPWTFDLELRPEGNRLVLIMQRGRFLGIPVPRALLPRIRAFEEGHEEVYRFDVEIGLPLIGRLVRYRGELTDR